MSILVFLAKLVRIVIAYYAACVVAGCAALGVVAIMETNNTGISVSGIMSFSWAIAILCSIPSVFAVVIFETANVRRWIAYASYGALLGGSLSVLLFGSVINRGFSTFFAVVGLFALAGIGSATVYWLVAGRHSGKAPSSPAEPGISASA